MTAPTMERVNQIRRHPLFQEQLSLLEQAESDRIFCCHTMEHFLDVARLMYLYRLEAGTSDPEKEILYAAALLHDIGRYEQIAKGTPHQEAGARLAGTILRDCGFSAAETARIQNAIRGHRRKEGIEDSDLLSIWLRRADKESRLCFRCPVSAACNWPEDKKNHEITY